MQYQEIAIPIGTSHIKGDITHIPHARSLVIFAHGSGSSRLSSRNKFVAQVLHQAHISTLLFDLLTKEEEALDNYSREFRFDIKLLAERLMLATAWLQEHHDLAKIKLGYFGASTGAAAAIIAAAQLPHTIHAVVSRGGRPDLAGDFLSQIQCPTLLIVGKKDLEVLTLNQVAFDQLQCTKELAIIPGATHLFEEEGTLEQASIAARVWFSKFL